jgi:hypothetical protein
VGKVFASIDEPLRAFIEEQHLFFVATAPRADEGLVNLSPKGLDSFRILGPQEVAYLDFVGSGVETIAHLRENGRIAVMFCALTGPPRILRLYGRGDVLEPGDEEFDALAQRFPHYAGTRAVIRISVTRIADACGFGVPRFTYEGERDQLLKWAERQGEEGLTEYARENNRESLDGLPGLRQ